jgi:hypothetical protein
VQLLPVLLLLPLPLLLLLLLFLCVWHRLLRKPLLLRLLLKAWQGR